MSKNVQECLMTYYKGKGMNCAETTLLAANEAWNLEIPEDSVKLMGGLAEEWEAEMYVVQFQEALQH